MIIGSSRTIARSQYKRFVKDENVRISSNRKKRSEVVSHDIGPPSDDAYEISKGND